MAINRNDAADPLQPGDPFKKGNFNKFTFGMMLFIVLFGALVLVFFLFHKSVPHTATPAAHTQLRLLPDATRRG